MKEKQATAGSLKRIFVGCTQHGDDIRAVFINTHEPGAARQAFNKGAVLRGGAALDEAHVKTYLDSLKDKPGQEELVGEFERALTAIDNRKKAAGMAAGR